MTVGLKFPKPTPRGPKARKPIRRSKRLRARGKTKHARRERDFDYMGEVAKLPCIVPGNVAEKRGLSPCEGRVEVDHAFGRRRPNSDREGIPLCSKHHREKTGQVGGGGFMSSWPLHLRRGWLECMVILTQAEVARRRGW